MEFCILGLGLLALVHFVYEGILAPSYRLEQRYRLFELRDELRAMKIKNADRLPEKHFNHLQHSLNALIRNVDGIDIPMLAAFRTQMQTDPEFRRQIEARAKIMDDCNLDEAKLLRNKSVKIVEHLITANNGAWAFYILPIVPALFCYQKVARWVKAITALTEVELDKVSIPSPKRKLHA